MKIIIYKLTKDQTKRKKIVDLNIKKNWINYVAQHYQDKNINQIEITIKDN